MPSTGDRAAGARDESQIGAAVPRTRPPDPSGIDDLPASSLPVSALKPGDSPRLAGVDPEHVRLIAEIPAAELPPILVQKDTLRVVDGMHRVRAARLRGDVTIAARLVDCTPRDAFLLAVQANTSHGSGLTLAERQAAAARILKTHPAMSNRAVAAIAGLAANTVGRIRLSTEHPAQSNSRLGRDGRRRPLNSGTGRQRATAVLTSRPAASLREIARQAGVSIATASDVRNRIRNGQDPLPPRLRAAETGNTTRKIGRPTANRGPYNTGKDVTWPLIRRKLAHDPSLKYAGEGRALLEWFDSHASGMDQLEYLVEAVPLHWYEAMANLARTHSRRWLEFAEELLRRGSEATDRPPSPLDGDCPPMTPSRRTR